MEISDIIVVGSGCCGSIVAKTLIDENCKITMLDVGIEQQKKYSSNESNFIEIRTKDEEQWKFLLGEKFETLNVLTSENPIHLTPNRFFVTDEVSKYYKWASDSFNAIESLAIGGLGNAWGLGSYVYSNAELEKTGLPINELKSAYVWLSKHIAISGGNDGAVEFSNGNLFEAQKPIPLDFNGERLYKMAQTKQNEILKQNFHIGRTPLAISTENSLNGDYHRADDLEFYDTENASAFRPINFIKQLKKNTNFKYISNQLVLSFDEIDNGEVILESLNVKTKQKEIYKCKKLIIAAGAIATARIVMRSTKINMLPILCNAYSYIPSFQPKLIGHQNNQYQTGLAQLSLYYDKNKSHSNVAMGSIYSYRALMNYRLINEFPLGLKDSTKILKYLMPALNITGIFHPEEPTPNKNITLVRDDNSLIGDKLKCEYEFSKSELNEISFTNKQFKSILKKIGSIPIKTNNNKIGSSIHYGGTIPFKVQKNNVLSHDSNGKLINYHNIFIADGSGFKFLSGKGLTLTLMAYAHHVAKKVIGK